MSEAKEIETLKVAESTYEVRRIITGSEPYRSLEVVEKESKTPRLVWAGLSSWARDVVRVFEQVDTDVVGLPEIIEIEESGEDTVLVLKSPPVTASAFDEGVWRAAPRDDAVVALKQFSLLLDEFHRANGWLKGIKRDELYVDLVTQEIFLVAAPRLFVSKKPTKEAAWRDMRVVGELAYENFVEAAYPGGHMMADMLQERTDLEGPILFPGLSQVLAGCVSPYGELAYCDAYELFSGLEQLRIELERPFEFRVGAASTVGNYLFRKNNQDSCGHILFQGICGSRKVNIGFFCVADGIGGIQDGEHASRLAVETACQAFARGWAHYGVEPLMDCPTEFARSIAKVVGQRLALEGEFEPRHNRGGTTFSGMVMAGDRIGVCHVGDSRIVLIRGDEFIELTLDHTLATILIELGEMTEAEATENDLSQRTISRFLSTATELEYHRIDGFSPRLSGRLGGAVERQGVEVRRGDLFILTSDGVHGEVEAARYRELIEDHGDDPQALADALVGESLDRLGRDNATALVVLVE